MPIPLGILAVAGAGAAGGGAYELIESTILTGNQASVTFSNLNTYTQYKHLQIRLTARSSAASGTRQVLMRVNGDTGTNYAVHLLNGTGSAVQSAAGTSETSMGLNRIPISTTTANVFAAAIVDVLDFSSSSKNATIRQLGGLDTPAEISLRSGLWNNTAALTSITLLPNVDSFVSGSRFSLYGIKG